MQTPVDNRLLSRPPEVVEGVGAFLTARDMRVIEAIATMGGFSAWAKKDRIKVIRNIDDKTVEYGFNYGAYTSGKAPDSNLLLMPGDTVVVPD